ncbi:MAG: phosphatase PAP2 family protein [Bacteroidota bacterium]|nr:phosphatase PAP2 family protein [Bacteroidota bacterium]
MRNLSFLFIILIQLNSFSQNADLRLLKTFNAGSMPMWDKTMEGVSFSVYPAMPLTVGGIWAYGYFNKDQEMMRNGYKGAIAIGFANCLTYGIKLAVKRDRPFVTHPNDITQKTHVGPLSFPSGHTTAAFATATALSLSTKKWQFAVPAYAYAGLVGYSRMRLGVHYPSDVLGGMIIGIGSGLLTWQIDRWIRGSKTP